MRSRPLWLWTFAILLAATLPRLALPGMFLDGVTHAAVARNLALGQGSFWTPFYTATLHPAFHEQPPLGLWLLSLAFRLGGDHLAVERIFSVAMACVTLLCLVGIWRRVHAGDPEARAQAWLPVALWAASPLSSWGVVNGALENVQTAFTTAAVALVLRALSDRRPASGAAALAGAAVLAGCLAKGPVALFVLALPLCWPLFWRGDARRAAAVGGVLAATLLAGSLALALWPEAREGLGQYLRQQLVPGVLGRRELGAGRLGALSALALRVLLPMGALAALLRVLARGTAPRAAGSARPAAFFLLGGLAASLPVLASAKQADRYLLPAVPLFALGVASLALPAARALAARLERRTRSAAAALALIAATIAVSALELAGPGRDRARIDDLRSLAGELAPGEVVALCPALWTDWGLHAWGQRLLRVSFARQWAAPAHFLAPKPVSCAIPPGCAPVPVATATFTLHRCLTLGRAAG